MQTKQELKNQIEKLYKKWSDKGLNEYEKIALKHLEDNYNLVK